MTQNEAKEYVNDINHWYVVGATDYARVRRLDYGDLHYAAIEHKRVTNHTEVYLEKAPAKTGFQRASCYLFDIEHDCLGYSVSETEMIKTIWKESKK